MNISQHLTLEEAIKSQTAERFGIDNTPSEAIIENMKKWAENIFEPLRAMVSEKRGKDSPLNLSSVYRCEKLNTQIGGAKNSQHTKGEAGDIEVFYPDFTKKDLFNMVKESNFPFDQMIWEFGNEEQPAWVHISYNTTGSPRKEILKALTVNGVTSYTKLS